MGVTGQETEREIQHFEKLVREHGTCWWGNETPAGQLRLERRGELAMLFTGMRPGMKVLELGCGAGGFTARLAKSGASITAIDVTPALIELARERVRAGNVRFEIADAYSLPFENGAFEAVVGYSILHHLDMTRALSEASRVLAPGGKAWFSEPNMLNPEIFLERKVRFIGKLMQNSPDETALVRWEAKRVFLNCGFRKVSVRPFDFLHPAIPVALVGPGKVLGRFLEATPLLREMAGSLEIRGER